MLGGLDGLANRNHLLAVCPEAVLTPPHNRVMVIWASGAEVMLGSQSAQGREYAARPLLVRHQTYCKTATCCRCPGQKHEDRYDLQHALTSSW